MEEIRSKVMSLLNEMLVLLSSHRDAEMVPMFNPVVFDQIYHLGQLYER